MSSLLVYRSGALGDALLAVPALAALRDRFAAGQVTVVTNPSVLPLLLASGLCDVARSQDDPRLLWLFSAAGVASETPRVDAAVVWSSAVSVGAVEELRRRGALVIQAPSRPSEGADEHASEYLLRTIAPLVGGGRCPRVPPLTPPPQATDAADAWLAQHDPGAHPLVALHPGSGSARKNWPADRFARVASLLAEAGRRPLFVVGPADADVEAALRRRPDWDRWLVAGALDVPTLAALLTRCRGYLGNDSGVSHLAAAMGTPTVALFGATDPRVWAPRGPRVRVLDDPGWRRLTPDAVASAVLELSR